MQRRVRRRFFWLTGGGEGGDAMGILCMFVFTVHVTMVVCNGTTLLADISNGGGGGGDDGINDGNFLAWRSEVGTIIPH